MRGSRSATSAPLGAAKEQANAPTRSAANRFGGVTARSVSSAARGRYIRELYGARQSHEAVVAVAAVQSQLTQRSVPHVLHDGFAVQSAGTSVHCCDTESTAQPNMPPSVFAPHVT
jgi:hypothetical protein